MTIQPETTVTKSLKELLNVSLTSGRLCKTHLQSKLPWDDILFVVKMFLLVNRSAEEVESRVVKLQINYIQWVPIYRVPLASLNVRHSKQVINSINGLIGINVAST